MENQPIRSCKHVILTLATVHDAEFILSLRQNTALNRFVSHVSPSLYAQKKWLEEYKSRELTGDEFYFIIRGPDMKPLGTVRIYDFKNDSFCWGSWMVASDAPRKTAIESALSIYEFAFYSLGFNQCHFDVRNENIKVIKFHNMMGAQETLCTDLDTFFIYSKENYEKIKHKYRSLFE